MHTGDDLTGVSWCLDGRDELIPDSFCDYRYLEQAFEHDPAFFLKTLGGQNAAEMHDKLIENPRRMRTDSEYFKLANETCRRWFQAELSEISQERKERLVQYLYRTAHTTVPQLARVIGLSRDRISQAIGKKKR